MDLYFLRHAIAQERPQFTGPDSQRPLTEEGIDRMKRVAKGIRALKVQPDRIVSSPYRRAVQTAELAAKGIKFDGKLEFSDAIRPESRLDDFLKLLSTFGKNETVMLVGHQPTLGQFTSFLVMGHPVPAIDFKKSGLAKIELFEVQPPSAVLKWLLTPGQLEDLA